jgi:glucose/arabinose dehydrogenase
MKHDDARMRFRHAAFAVVMSVLLCGCDSGALAQPLPFAVTVKADFDEPWALAFLPDARALVTEKRGRLLLWSESDGAIEIDGVPEVRYRGQGGFGDVALHPDFASNDLIYLSYAEPGAGGEAGAAVARARLDIDSRELRDLEVIWRQVPKVSGGGHYGHRLLFDADGFLWVSSGERQKFDPSQDMTSNMGKILRLNEDGSVPADNPFVGDDTVTAQIWSLGHRNPLGIAIDATGQLWNIEMGPRGGDELNRVERGANYGYPIVSNGNHYNGRDIPDHHTRPEFAAPVLFWDPVISPSSLIFYDGSEFPQWRGNAFISGLSSQSLVRVEFTADGAREAQRFSMGARIRAVVQGADGALWVLEDGGRGSDGRLLRLTQK